MNLAHTYKTVFIRIYTHANDDRLVSVAASVAFFVLLALIPGLSVFISLYALFVEPSAIFKHLETLLPFLPIEAHVLLKEQIVRLAEQSSSVLSLKVLISFVVSVVSATAGMKSLFDGLNVAYGETEKRGFFVLNSLAALATLAAVLTLMFALLVIAFIPTFLSLLPFQNAFETVFFLLRWPIFFTLGTVVIAVLYWMGPSRTSPRLKHEFYKTLPGALIASLFWFVASAAFSWYVSTLGNYTATYGSLATVIVFMTWLWLSVCVILLGAEVNAALSSIAGKSPARLC
jgi:membrane protein